MFLDELVQKIKVTADTKAYDTLNKKQAQAVKQNNLLASSFKRAFGFITAGYALRATQKYADEWTNIASSLALVTKSRTEQLDVEEKLFTISQKTRQSMRENVDLYKQMAMATESMGLTQSQKLTAVENINKALTIGGGTKASNQASLVQLQQALGSGTLRGQELRSVMLQSPRLARVISDYLGLKNIGQLKDYGEKGKLTSEVVINALLASTQKLNKEFAKMKPTIGQAFVVMNNALGKFVSRTEKAGGLSEIIAKNIIEMAKVISSPKVLQAMQRIGLIIKVIADNIKTIFGMYLAKLFFKGAIFDVFLLNLTEAGSLLIAIKNTLLAFNVAGILKGVGLATLAFAKWALVIGLVIEAIDTLKGKDTYIKKIFDKAGEKIADFITEANKLSDENREKRGVLTEKSFLRGLAEQNAVNIALGSEPLSKKQYGEMINWSQPKATFNPTINIYNAQNLDENAIATKIKQVQEEQFTRFNYGR